MAEDCNILDVESSILYELIHVLDEHKSWQSLLEVAPPTYSKFLQNLELYATNPDHSPTKKLILHWGSQNVSRSMVISWLEEINLLKALLILKEDEPLEIIEQPVSSKSIAVHSTLLLTCIAKSFPPPEYQWFNGEEELLLQQESNLKIQNVRLENSGVYRCKVSKRDRSNGEITEIIISTPSEIFVTINDDSIQKNHKENMLLFDAKEKIHENYHDAITVLPSLTNFKAKKKKTCIEIIKHPVCSKKVAQGSTILLMCSARSDCCLKYQWLCNGREIEGETSYEIKLENLYPDQETGEVKWVYECEIYCECDRVLSRSVTVELETADDSTQYFAEEKIALLIANDTYENLRNLHTPAKDLAVISKLLDSIGFKILALRNLKYTEMKNAVDIFCSTLRPNAYGLFFYAGHGFSKCMKQTYFQPVDCSKKIDPDKSMCVEYVVQRMQARNSALNVILVDSCQTLPSELKNEIQQYQEELFEPHMRRNTIYGFATSFLCASYENDEESSSFFVKYLKKYIAKKMKIHDVLWNVQKDFEADPLIKDLQYPCVISSLYPSRCLTDTVIGNSSKSVFNEILSWTNIKSPVFEEKYYHIPIYCITIVMEFYHHLEVFCNGIDIHLSLDVEENAVLLEVDQIELDAVFPLNDDVICTKYRPVSSLECGKCSLQCIVQIHRLQKLEVPLDGYLLIKHRPSGEILKMERVTLEKPKIQCLKL